MNDPRIWVATGLMSLGIAVSYATVLFNAFGGFDLPPALAEDAKSYLRSPYWVGLPWQPFGSSVQVLAPWATVWSVYVYTNPPTRGLLQDRRWFLGALSIFLVASTAWPYAAHQLVRQPKSLAWALASSARIWLAAAGVVVLVGGTFEAQYDSPLPVLGILFLALVVVIADGIGWSAAAIFRSLYE